MLQNWHSPRVADVFRFALLVGTSAGVALAQDLACERVGLSRQSFQRLIGTQFTRILSPQASASIGNFGAYDSKNGEITFSGSVVRNNRRALTFKVSGKGGDGLLPLVTDGESESAFKADVQVHYMGNNRSSLDYTSETCASSRRDSLVARVLYTRDSTLLRAGSTKNRRLVLEETLKAQATIIRKLTDDANSLRNSTKSLPDGPDRAKQSDELGVITRRLDSLTAANSVTIKAAVAAAVDTIDEGLYALVRIGRERAVALKNAESQLRVVAFRVGWFSLGYSAGGATFKLVDSSAAFGAQVNSESYISHTFRAQYSYYAGAAGGGITQFWSAGVSVSRSDNLGLLKKGEFTEVRQFGPIAESREARKVFNAYEGEYERDVATGSLYADYYGFLLRDNTTALHLYPSVDWQQGAKGAANLGFGIVSTFTKTTDASSRFNAELYYRLNDLGNVRDSNRKLFERGQLGVRFSVPFTFTPLE